eukprot:scaffold2094_cov239-Pinguiococcus_pyrenoidosus.AAC.1
MVVANDNQQSCYRHESCSPLKWPCSRALFETRLSRSLVRRLSAEPSKIMNTRSSRRVDPCLRHEESHADARRRRNGQKPHSTRLVFNSAFKVVIGRILKLHNDLKSRVAH